jgi:hypothetical protein
MKLLRLIFVPAAVVVFAGAMLFAWVPRAIAQDDSSAAPAAEISCRSNFGNPVELDKEFWRFVSATAEEIAFRRAIFGRNNSLRSPRDLFDGNKKRRCG